MTAAIDRVSAGVMWDRLISIANETVETLVRTSFSTLVRESYDLACMIFDENGRLISQGSEGQPAFVGTGTATLRHMLEAIPADQLSEGDVVITNDAWHGTGHLWDVTIMRPVFLNGRIVAFILSVSHLPDIGGRGLSAQNVSIYEEGLQLPVVRLSERGRLNAFVLDLIATNVRVPDQVIGDVMANVSCTEAGSRLLLELMHEYQLDSISEISSIIIKQSDDAMRQSIRRLRDGIYRNSVRVDVLDGVTLSCAIGVSDDRLVVDFSGTTDQIAAGVNVPLCYTRAISAYSLKSLLLPEVPNNQGVFDAVEIKAPPGCILNAQRPSATGARMLVGHYVMPLIFGALVDVLPHAVQAEAGMMNGVNFVGRGADGRQFSTLFFTSGALGAMHGLDGLSATPAPASVKTMSAEMWETLTGVSIRARSLRSGSGGKGRWRGGEGQSIVFRNDTLEPLSVSLLGSRCKTGAKGYAGGLPGGTREFLINGDVVDPLGQFQIEVGGTLTVNDAGGGGYGRPEK
jgi:N-methylhydantoinase B